MKTIRFIFLVFLLALSSLSFAQERKDNRNFFKLYVINDKKEVLLIKFQEAWEIPGAAYKIPQTIAQFLDTIAQHHGITITDKKLRGQITFHHEIREEPTIMLYYTAKYQSGELNTPKWGQDLKWVPLEQAYQLIPFPEMVEIMKKMNEDKKTVWGAALKITYDKDTKRRKGFEVLENFYKLN